MTDRPQLIDWMPYWLRRQDATGDYAKWMSVLQGALDEVYAILDRYHNINDVDTVDLEAIVDLDLADLGNPFDVSRLTLTQKRLLVRALVNIYRAFGTDPAIRVVVATFTNLVVTDIIKGQFSGWILGTHVLGDGIHPISFDLPTSYIYLYPSRLFQIYSFMIDLDAVPTQDQQDVIKALMKIVKPAYMHYIGVHGIAPTPVHLHWELGISELGITSDLH